MSNLTRNRVMQITAEGEACNWCNFSFNRNNYSYADSIAFECHRKNRDGRWKIEREGVKVHFTDISISRV